VLIIIYIEIVFPPPEENQDNLESLENVNEEDKDGNAGE